MRGRGDVLMGKNTMMKRAMKELIGDKPELEKLIPLITGNVGLVLTNGDLKEIRDLIKTFKVIFCPKCKFENFGFVMPKCFSRRQ